MIIDEVALRALILAATTEAQRPLVARLDALVTAHSQRWVSRAEAAEALGVSIDTIDRRLGDGTLRVRRIGRSIRVLLKAPASDDDVGRLAAEARQ